jgi:superoxide dismutase, Fe-Mn family
MAYEPQSYDHLLGMKGFSDTLLKNHFTLYGGYVTNTNKVLSLLQTMLQEGKIGTPQYAELKRRFGWEFNGMRLHELYFGNMHKESGKVDEGSAFGKQLATDFGSLEAWEKDFKTTGALRGIGWVVLSYDPVGNKMFNVWVNEHDLGYLAGSQPLLIMDVFEHAFMLDYGLKRAEYIDSFFNIIDWSVVEKRFNG